MHAGRGKAEVEVTSCGGVEDEPIKICATKFQKDQKVIWTTFDQHSVNECQSLGLG